MSVIPDPAPLGEFARQCDELGYKITGAMFGYSKEVAICTLPAVLAAAVKALGVPRDTMVEMLDTALEDIGD